MQADWKSADEIAEDIRKEEANVRQLIVDLWSRVEELEKKVSELQARLRGE
jgi:polyhydroxyalkanoate synthesis regulator phasin